MLPSERKGSVSMTPLQSQSGARLLPNPLLCRGKLYGPAERAVLSLAKAAEAERQIRAWDGYRATPLRRLARLAATARVGEIAYKDEGCRAPLGSFKMLAAAMRWSASPAAGAS
jgi:diaminopropionate ammonia-lyase